MTTMKLLLLVTTLLATVANADKLDSMVTRREYAVVKASLAHNHLLRNNSVINMKPPEYKRGALIQVMNYLKFPLIAGSATAIYGQMVTEMAQRIRPGSFEQFWVAADGVGGDSGHCQGAGQFKIAGNKGAFENLAVYFMWAIPNNMNLWSSFAAVGIRSQIFFNNDKAYERMYYDDAADSNWFNRTGKIEKSVIFRKGSLIVMGYRDDVFDYKQRMSIRIVSTNPKMNYDFTPGANNGDGASFPNEALETAMKIGTTGVVVWAVVLFFVIGLLCIFACKIFAWAKKKYGSEKKHESESDDSETAVDHYKDYKDDDELAKAVESLKKPPDTLVVEHSFIYRAKITTDV